MQISPSGSSFRLAPTIDQCIFAVLHGQVMEEQVRGSCGKSFFPCFELSNSLQ